MAPFMQTRDQQTRQGAVEQLAQQYGLFYFYRGSDPIDVQMAGVVADFAKTNGLSLIPVSVDGRGSHTAAEPSGYGPVPVNEYYALSGALRLIHEARITARCHTAS